MSRTNTFMNLVLIFTSMYVVDPIWVSFPICHKNLRKYDIWMSTPIIRWCEVACVVWFAAVDFSSVQMYTAHF